MDFYFYSHAPCGARPIMSASGSMQNVISTHTPLAGRDNNFAVAVGAIKDFYSHAPCGARPIMSASGSMQNVISTHTPLAGRDIDIGIGMNEDSFISTHTPLAGRDG